MKYLRQYIRNILTEDLAGFMQDAQQISQKSQIFSKKDKSAGKQLKKIYHKHRDKAFLDSLNTVHWVDSVGELSRLQSKYRDELSCVMSLPNTPLKKYWERQYGLWVEGWITYATNTEDCLYSGYASDYHPPMTRSGEIATFMSFSDRENWPEEKIQQYKHQKASSGVNKVPRANPAVWDASEDGSCVMLDQESWESLKTLVPDRKQRFATKMEDQPNEALVDNWRPKAFVVRGPQHTRAGEMEKLKKLAESWNIPIVDLNKKPIWKP